MISSLTEREINSVAVEYVDFPTAQLLRSAGFPQHINLTQFYNKNGQDWHFGDGSWVNGYARPTIAQAMRWLRLEKNKSIDIVSWPKGTGLEFSTYGNPVKCEDSYELAANKAISEVCGSIINERNNNNIV